MRIGIVCYPTVGGRGVVATVVAHARASKGAEVDPQAIAEFEKQFRTTPERAAAIILRGIRKKKSRILVGTDAHIFHFAAHRMRFLLRYFLKRGLKKTVGKA